MNFQTQVLLDQPVALRWTLDDKGLAALLSATEAKRWQDMVMVTDRAVCAVTRQRREDGSVVLRIAPDSVLSKGSYVANGVMTQTQRQRSSVLNAVTDKTRWVQPTVLGWSGLIDDGLRDEAKVERRGEALWMIPMRLSPVAAGRRVVVPWPLVRIDRKSTRLNSSHIPLSRMPSSA